MAEINDLLNDFFLLSEADDIEEPTEKDSEMNTSDSTNNEIAKNNNDQSLNDTEPSEDESDNIDSTSNDDSLNDDIDTTDINNNDNVKDTFKKRKLFDDYKNLLELYQNLINSISLIPYRELSEDAKKIFIFVERKINENNEKLKIIIMEQYFNIEYKELLTLYIYLKIAAKNFTEIIKNFVE